MRNTDKIIKLVTAALMAAMTCIVTMILPIRIPFGGGGYIHPGDGFVLLSGIILGPIYGGLAAGVGSILADLLNGYPQYAIATFVIKFIAAMLAAFSYRRIRKNSVILAGVFAGIVVTFGYFVFEIFLYDSLATPLFNAPFNLLQNIVGIIIASILLPLLLKVPQIRAMIEKK